MEDTDKFVNTPMNEELLSALEFIRVSREYTARTDAVRYAIKRTAKLLGWNPDALPADKKAKAAA